MNSGKTGLRRVLSLRETLALSFGAMVGSIGLLYRKSGAQRAHPDRGEKTDDGHQAG